MLTLLLSACTKTLKPQEDRVLVAYFFDKNENRLITEETTLPKDIYSNQETLMKAMIERVLEGPDTANLQTIMPQHLKIIDSTLKEHTAYINFDQSYKDLKLAEQIVVRASLVYSLTEIETIQNVEFMVNGEVLTNNSQVKIGPMTRANVLVGVPNPNPQTNTQTITLYFAKQNSNKLYAETREIQVNNTIPIERYIVEQLVKGPTRADLIRTLPENTKINDVSQQERVCQVDISYDLSNKIVASINEKLLIYSIVNSITDNTQIEKVVFLMDGKKQTDLSTSLDFRRDESLIETDE